MVAHGSDGLSGLKSRILGDETEQVYFGFYREEIKARPGFVVVNYIPPSVSGVRRGEHCWLSCGLAIQSFTARALVHSRRITSGFTRVRKDKKVIVTYRLLIVLGVIVLRRNTHP